MRVQTLLLAATTFATVSSTAYGSTAYGFVPVDKPSFYSVKLAEGNYNVTVTLGDANDESVTTVKAEARRLMLENVKTAKGEIMKRTFTVNVRTPRIETNGAVRLKEREKETEMVTWDDSLTLEFSGAQPRVRSPEISPAPEVPTIFL